MAQTHRQRQQRLVLGVPIDAITWEAALKEIVNWAARRESRYVCICNVHSVVTCGANSDFARAVANADLTTPDGAPVAWMLRRLGFPDQKRINGPDLMWRYLAQAERLSQVVFFYGSTASTLAMLCEVVAVAFPTLVIGGTKSPSFGLQSPAEDAIDVEEINQAGTAVVFVGLGCPKQELWMAAHRGRVAAVMIGVGAAFDYHAGRIRRAPEWMQNCGLEWLHRLSSEPRRLWRRYLVTNAIFLWRATQQLLVGPK